jgi:LysM repeat protein
MEPHRRWIILTATMSLVAAAIAIVCFSAGMLWERHSERPLSPADAWAATQMAARAQVGAMVATTVAGLSPASTIVVWATSTPISLRDTASRATSALTYTVRPGDTLREIGSVTGIPSQTIAQLNGINECAALYAGQVLRLPTSAQEGALSASVSAGASLPPGTPYVYRVQAGDTLPNIGERFGVPWCRRPRSLEVRS